ncbi:hypothetical protein Bca52824_024140 [Brassica carinata]|uniref:Uncharacterized protein n=1 Tax=Brassica carinata TaxID=52824 RepID=A0A8X7VK25_BRACI|nr:hypothetical protein Bca52824_024140 [Brassica carinata]
MQRRWRGQPFHQSRACQVVESISSLFFISRTSINEREATVAILEKVGRHSYQNSHRLRDLEEAQTSPSR